MKKNFHRISVLGIFLFSILSPHSSNAAAKKDVTARINKVRKTLSQKIQDNKRIELTGLEFNKSTELREWVNWGNWGNWNNWNNWANWANWNNWSNWLNG
jgi:hypothetical protein